MKMNIADGNMHEFSDPFPAGRITLKGDLPALLRAVKDKNWSFACWISETLQFSAIPPAPGGAAGPAC